MEKYILPEIRVQNDLTDAGIEFSTELKVLSTKPDLVIESRKTRCLFMDAFGLVMRVANI
jgi:G:T-mismatch repair DNA endonuclease (very short patch repair protein)